MWAMTLSESGLPPLQWGVVLGASLVAAVTDLGQRRIPNRLTGALAASGLVFAGCCGGLAGLADAAAACVTLAFPFVLLFLFAGGGAGDAKLMGAIGCWLGLVHGTAVLVAVVLCGVVLAVFATVGRRQVVPTIRNLYQLAQAAALVVLSRGRFRDIGALVPATEEMQTLPYAVAILSGVGVAATGACRWIA